MAQWVLQGGCGQIQPTGWVAATAGQICLQIPVLITELPDLQFLITQTGGTEGLTG